MSRPISTVSRRRFLQSTAVGAAAAAGVIHAPGVLRAQGAEVQTSYNALDVLTTLVPHSHVVIIADLGMPGIDGYELARRIRADSSNAGVHLIALSGWGQEADRARAEAAGFDAHLIKPADIEALLTLLASFHAADGDLRKIVGN